MSMKRKRQALAICAVIAPLVENLIGMKASLEACAIAAPWGVIYLSTAVCIVSGILISRGDGQIS